MDPKVLNSPVPANFCHSWPKVLICLLINLPTFIFVHLHTCQLAFILTGLLAYMHFANPICAPARFPTCTITYFWTFCSLVYSPTFIYTYLHWDKIVWFIESRTFHGEDIIFLNQVSSQTVFYLVELFCKIAFPFLFVRLNKNLKVIGDLQARLKLLLSIWTWVAQN